MKVYLVDEYQIFTYSLPNKIEDAFVINYVHYSGKEETITFIAENNQWAFQSTSEIQYSNENTPIDKDYLKDDSAYIIQFSDLTSPINLYCFDAHQAFHDFAFPVGRDSILFGRSGNCDFLYDNPHFGTPEFKISKQNNVWIFEDNGQSNTKVYINQRRVRKTILNLGDIIFSNGLKVIWMETFIKINNPQDKVQSSCSPLEQEIHENTYSPIKDTERSVTLYNDNQVFFHTPRMKQAIEKKVITIEKPPQYSEMDTMPIILSVGTTGIMGVSSLFTGIVAASKLSSGEAVLEDVMSELVLCITMVIGCMVLPTIIDRYNRHVQAKREKNRKKIYREYLASIKETIKQEIANQQSILIDNFYDAELLKKYILNQSNKVWSREITDSDFLVLRLGLGDKKAAIELEYHSVPYDVDKDVLLSEAQKLSEEKMNLTNVPITISLVKNNVLPIVISNDYAQRRAFMNYILLQLMCYYSGKDLKIVIFTTKTNASQWSFLKYLPHCSNDTKSMRFYAETEDEAKQVSAYLEKEYQRRWARVTNVKISEEDEEKDPIPVANDEEIYKYFEPYYLIITDNYIVSKRYGIVQNIVEHSKNIGFSLVTFEPTMQNVPSRCENMVVINNNSAGIVNKSLNENDTQNTFTPDLMTSSMKTCSDVIANIPLATESVSDKLPKMLAFLEMYKVGKIEQLNILNRWAKNDPTTSISAPVGVHEDGKLFELDLHEKAHGPHGLVAGSTGSGKSEFIITYILSMAINYSPYEVQFVLIDYKGGGLAGAFENKETGIKLPHLAGTITNLDVSEMNRTLFSINSELKRRQSMFNEARDALNESTIDIYKYQKFYREGKVKEPMSHLFIISDEFAELKSQQPEFMDALVSTARIGRSLGVHLILATQKPSGVVDDQIWSNSRFKVCLKVATSEDSRELLRRPEAAEIKETGRFYLQVGFNELFELGQSAWAGAKYNPTDQMVKVIDDSISFLDNVGNVIRVVTDSKVETQENHGEQLTNIVETLYNIAQRENIKTKAMWLPSLPAEIYLANLVKKYQYKAEPYYLNPLIGEYDDPERQFQGKFEVDLTKNGNLLIYGLAGSGKENIVSTLIYSVCMYHSSSEVNIYLMDFGAEVLKVYKDMPQVGDIILIDDKDKVKSLLLMIEREQTRRKELFSEYGGSYQEYIRTSGKKIPTILIILNGWEVFSESYGNYVDIVSHQLRECAKYGIIYITTCVTTNGMTTAMQQNYLNKIALQLNDPFDYKYIMDARDGLIPRKEFSRGLSFVGDNTYEFQGAYIYLKDKINDVIKTMSDKQAAAQKKAPVIPVIPVTVTADSLAPYITTLDSVPLGVDIHTGSVFTYDFLGNKITQVIGNFIITEKDFLNELLKTLNLVQDIKLKILDFADVVDEPDEFEDYANGEFTNAINQIVINEQEETKKVVYVLIGIGRVYDKVLDEGIELLCDILQDVSVYDKTSFIIIDNYSAFRKAMKEEWYKNVDPKKGIWVGADVDVQTAIATSHMSKGDINEEFGGIVYASNGDQYAVLKGIGSHPEEE